MRAATACRRAAGGAIGMHPARRSVFELVSSDLIWGTVLSRTAALLILMTITSAEGLHFLAAMADVHGSYAFVLCWSIDQPGGVNEVVRNLIEEFRVAGEYINVAQYTAS